MVLWQNWTDYKDKERSRVDQEKDHDQDHTFDEYINLFMDGFSRDENTILPLYLNHVILRYEGSISDPTEYLMPYCSTPELPSTDEEPDDE